MVVDYIKEHIDTIDRNGDGVIGYVLATHRGMGGVPLLL